ncbi:MAG: Rid family hydrolase [Pseudomonadota bacterium]
MKSHTPSDIHPPFARYAHGVEVPSGYRTLFVSGQLGIDAAAQVPGAAGDQADLCFANARAVLAAAGMGPGDVVRVNAFVTDRAHLPEYMAARDRFFADVAAPPASTLMIVAGFARPEFKVEVELVAAAR